MAAIAIAAVVIAISLFSRAGTSTTTSTGTTVTTVSASTASTTTSSVGATQSTTESTSSASTTSTVAPIVQCSAPADANYSLQYTTSDWYVYAYNSTWAAHRGYYQSQVAYLDQVYTQLSAMFGVNPGRLYLMIDQHTGGGFAAGCISEIGRGPGIGIAYDAWYNPYSGSDNWSVELIAHESTNVFTGYVVGGWPRDWWADDKSPFPFATKILIEQATGHAYAAYESTLTADSLTRMFLDIGSSHPGIYGRMFANLSADSWTYWFGPNPSQALSDYVAAYLSIAAGTSMATTINSAFASEGGFNYTINATAVNDIIARRAEIESLSKSSACWQLFRDGDFHAVSC